MQSVHSSFTTQAASDNATSPDLYGRVGGEEDSDFPTVSQMGKQGL